MPHVYLRQYRFDYLYLAFVVESLNDETLGLNWDLEASFLHRSQNPVTSLCSGITLKTLPILFRNSYQ